MFATESIFAYLSLMFCAVTQAASSTGHGVNRTTSDGKVVINGDHNEIVVSTARETKIALAEINSKLQSLSKKNEEFSRKLKLIDAINETLSKTVESQDERIERKLDLVNMSNAALSAQVQVMSQRLTTLEKEGRPSEADYALQFPRKGTSDYVITSGMPNLTAVTVCFWMKTADTVNRGTPLSYSSAKYDNELFFLGYNSFRISLGPQGGNFRETSVSANDGKWHHICLTWENTAGSWNFFKDGTVAASGKDFQTGEMIRGGGALVLGQEQDSEGGSFDANQSFIGEMTSVDIWDHVIKDQEIMRMSKTCLTGVGNVFQWRDFKAYVKGSVNIIKPSC